MAMELGVHAAVAFSRVLPYYLYGVAAIGAFIETLGKLGTELVHKAGHTRVPEAKLRDTHHANQELGRTGRSWQQIAAAGLLFYGAHIAMQAFHGKLPNTSHKLYQAWGMRAIGTGILVFGVGKHVLGRLQYDAESDSHIHFANDTLSWTERLVNYGSKAVCFYFLLVTAAQHKSRANALATLFVGTFVVFGPDFSSSYLRDSDKRVIEANLGYNV